MEQSAQPAASSDFPPRKFVRQLDFTAAEGSGGPSSATESSVLEPSQQQRPLPRIFSRCCECFAAGVYCDGCKCTNCCNNVDNESVRHVAVEATLERNPNAFRPKIGSSTQTLRDSMI
ncbi:protein tesmin/TSO1-like CXC 6 [Curcuma longa]|uniref:protein tesmin/TSO1-like CXC 6 n=1 Tax=Curcuma longa TaxID=136217 RepID=UPI003D9FA781